MLLYNDAKSQNIMGLKSNNVTGAPQKYFDTKSTFKYILDVIALLDDKT